MNVREDQIKALSLEAVQSSRCSCDGGNVNAKLAKKGTLPPSADTQKRQLVDTSKPTIN